jgi:hypothetical protein
MTMPPRSHVGWSFGFTWALATFTGSISGLFMGLVYFPLGWIIVALSEAGIDIVRLYTEKFVAALSVGIMTGLMIGLLQYLLLRKQIKYAGWWILTTVLGWVVGLIIAHSSSDFVWVYMLSGALSGVLQFFILWHQVNSALLWTVANLAGWFIGGVFGLFIGPMIAGLITGFSMIWLLNSKGQRFTESDSSA